MTTTRDVRSAVHDGTSISTSTADHGEIAYDSGGIGRVAAGNPADGGTR